MKLAIIGLGLIGGSLAKAAVRAGHTVLVWNRTRTTAERAVADGAAAAVLDEASLASCEVVFVALPLPAIAPWIDAHAALFGAGAIVVDCAGAKRTVCAALRKYALGTSWTFIGGHPMAGKEVGGYANATAALYEGASMILTPFPSMGRGPLDKLEPLLRSLGFARIVSTTPERHDEMIALTSQLAHVVSSAYVRDPLAREQAGFSAGSFADMTRVASVDPAMWTDLFLANRDDLGAVLGRFMRRLGEYRDALESNDATALRTLLEDGRKAKEELK